VLPKEVQLNRNGLKNNLLQSKNKYGYTTPDRAAERDNLEALETLLSWSKQAQVNPDESNINFCLVQTVFYMATKDNTTETLEKHYVWSKDRQTESK